MKFILILPILFFCSCTSLDKDFVRSIDNGMKKIAPNYILYIEKDDTISLELKEARREHLQELINLIDDAKKLVGLRE